MSTMNDRQHPPVMVAVATFRRNDDLRDLLPLLATAAGEISPPASVLIVDNDPAAGARELVGASDAAYVHEPEPGIAAARNRALAEAGRRGAGLIVFLDDDERPTPGWLAALVQGWQAWGSAGVAGPVITRFTQPPDAWVLGSGTFEPRGHAHGGSLPAAATNNLLLDLAQLDRHGLEFDPRYGLSGGSDSKLTRQMTSLGLEIRWTTAATVTEVMPAPRTSRAWVRRRHLRTGNVWSRVALDLAGSTVRRGATRLSLTARGLHRAGRGLLGVLIGLLTSDIGRRARGECDLATACGVVLGVVGIDRVEYRRPGRA